MIDHDSLVSVYHIFTGCTLNCSPYRKSIFMGVILGVIFHFIGGFASGSFYMPFKKVKKWRWESYWIIGGLFSWLIVPPIAAWITVPGFAEVICNTSSDTIAYTLLFGVL